MAQLVWAGESGAGSGPLVTYRVQCHEHEAFVREAIESVLAQTYRPVEILITDDASTDRTFEIAGELAHAYRGPHRVLLHRIDRSRDTIEHFNETLHLIRGELFFSLDGDDVAEPDQVERAVAAWRQDNVSCVWSNLRSIDENGRDCGVVLSPDHPYTLDLCDYADGRFLDFPHAGAGCYHRSVLDRFGPLPAHLGARGHEHHLGFRAAVLGRKCHLPEPLVRRRRHPNQVSAGENHRDRHDDPMTVHERQVRVRLQVLTACRDTVARPGGGAHDARHADVADALSRQIVNEVRRLLEFETFRALAQRQGDAAPEHSGRRYPPNRVSFVRALPEHAANLIAAECKYFAAPWIAGVIEPYGLRNHIYPGLVGAWTEEALLAALLEPRRIENAAGLLAPDRAADHAHQKV